MSQIWKTCNLACFSWKSEINAISVETTLIDYIWFSLENKEEIEKLYWQSITCTSPSLPITMLSHKFRNKAGQENINCLEPVYDLLERGNKRLFSCRKKWRHKNCDEYCSPHQVFIISACLQSITVLVFGAY